MVMSQFYDPNPSPNPRSLVTVTSPAAADMLTELVIQFSIAPVTTESSTRSGSSSLVSCCLNNWVTDPIVVRGNNFLSSSLMAQFCCCQPQTRSLLSYGPLAQHGAA